jgi:hypothetical protein
MGNKGFKRRQESPTRDQRYKNVDRLPEGINQTAKASSALGEETLKAAESKSEPNDFKKIGRPKYFISLTRPKDPRKKSEITLYACLRS